MIIRNKTKDFYPNCTKRMLRVLDSKCVLYKQQLQDAWLVRIYKQFQDCLKFDGKVIFLTPTYNDICHPRYRYRDPDGNERSFMCFSKRDKDRFLNSLLKRWELHGFTGKTLAHPFKYVWACEYGQSPDGTKRCHYHVLLFIPKEILDLELSLKSINDTEEEHWKKLLQSYWTLPRSKQILGHIGWSRHKVKKQYESIFVEECFASIYVSKYMFKDSSFLVNPEVQKYLEYFNTLPDDGKRKGMFTSHWQSFGIGESLCELYKDPLIFKYGLNLELSSEVRKGKSVRHRCPQYIARKIHYDYDKVHNQYKLNSFGQLVRGSDFPDKYRKMLLRYRKFFNDQYLDRLLGDDCTLFSDVKTKIGDIFGDRQVFLDWLHNVDSRKNWLEVCCLYSLSWSGLLVDQQTYDKISSCDFDEFYVLSHEKFIDNLAPHLRYPWSPYSCEFGVFDRDGALRISDLVSTIDRDFVPPLFLDVSQHPFFKEMDLFLDCIDEIYIYYRQRCQKKFDDDANDRRNVKFDKIRCHVS